MWQTRLQCVLLVLLVAYLLVEQWRRARRWRQSARGQPIRAGKAIEVAALQSRIHHLREDYVTAVRMRSSKAPGREQVAASIRQTIQRLAYFRNRRAMCSEDGTREISIRHP